MDPVKLTEAVVRDLARHRGRNDIILSICNTTGMDWKQAEAFVQQVERTQRKRIAGRQAPLLLVLAGMSIVGGFSTVVAMVDAALSGTILFLPGLPIPYLGNVVYFGLGVLAIAGGLLGVWRLTRDMRQD
ncbi:MAG TPA: hypothetical protein VFI11_13250 [Anaerolineales bacterium]|nr:hypothetical protein [Anaerolineales bacterium]